MSFLTSADVESLAVGSEHLGVRLEEKLSLYDQKMESSNFTQMINQDEIDDIVVDNSDFCVESEGVGVLFYIAEIKHKESDTLLFKTVIKGELRASGYELEGLEEKIEQQTPAVLDAKLAELQKQPQGPTTGTIAEAEVNHNTQIGG